MAGDLAEKKKVGVALGGGAVLGAAHLGVLRALQEADVKVEYIAGTSIGAFIAALFACGKGLDEIEDTLVQLDWLDITRFSLSRLGLLSNEKLGKQLIKLAGIDNIAETALPLGIVATDISNGERVVFTKGSLGVAVRASTCVPGIFIPVKHDDKLLVDGGLVDNVPVSVVRDLGADYVIGIDLSASRAFQEPDDLIDVLVNSIDIAIDNATQMRTSDADLLIAPELSAGSRTDKDRIGQLVADGYRSTRKQLRDL